MQYHNDRVPPKPWRFWMCFLISFSLAMIVGYFLRSIEAGNILIGIACGFIIIVGLFIGDVWANGDGPND